MEISWDDISFGNPNIEQIELMGRKTYLDGLFDKLSVIQPPKNTSEVTQKELNDLVAYTAELAQDEESKERFLDYDRSMFTYFQDACHKVGIMDSDTITTIGAVIQDTTPLLIRLKFNYDRARPANLAHYYKLKLFPFSSRTADTPSYPSGHAYQARIITEVIGNLHPRYYQSLKILYDDICMSRMYLGLHYQSDIDMGLYAADAVLDNREFKKKYGL